MIVSGLSPTSTRQVATVSSMTSCGFTASGWSAGPAAATAKVLDIRHHRRQSLVDADDGVESPVLARVQPDGGAVADRLQQAADAVYRSQQFIDTSARKSSLNRFVSSSLLLSASTATKAAVETRRSTNKACENAPPGNPSNSSCLSGSGRRKTADR